LRDQFDAIRVLAFPTTNLTVLTLADKKGSDEIAGWVAPIHQRFPQGLAIEGIADVSAVPRPLRPLVRRQFQKAQAHPVMLDWTGEASKQLAIRPHRANVLVLDCRGNILKRMTGPATQEAVEELCALIEQHLAPTRKEVGAR
jgi:hypothetical protein